MEEYNVIEYDGRRESIYYTGTYEECQKQISMIDSDAFQTCMYSIRQIEPTAEDCWDGDSSDSD